jgi:hypothetical protein
MKSRGGAADRGAARLRRVRTGRPARGCDPPAPARGAPARRNEKAHTDIYNILLQVMDHATLTDNTGRKADFRQSC